jgi:hypothetical protein
MLDLYAGAFLVLEDGSELAVTRVEGVVHVTSSRVPLRLTQGESEWLRAELAFAYLEPRA